MKYFKHFIEFITFYISVSLLKCLPNQWVLFILQHLFFLVGYVIGIRKKNVLFQLKLVFPEKDEQEIIKLAKRVYSELAITSAEVFVFNNDYFNNRIEVVGLDNVNNALKLGHGAIIVTAHFSNWELGARVLTSEFKEAYTIVKKQSNLFFNNYIEKKRLKLGIKTIEMKNAMRGVLHALKKNHVVAFIIDQYAFKQGIELDFLGHKTRSYSSVAQLAIKYKVPIIPAFIVRDDERKSRLIFHNPLIYENLQYTNENITHVTGDINKYIEEYIRRYPHLWFWVHKKWRTRKSI